MSTLSPPTYQSEIISRAIEGQPEGLSPEAARYFLALRLDARDEVRANELADKARQGTLTDEEALELDEYRRSLRFMDIIKLKARLTLQRVP
jgi:hypothetical protein